LIESYSGHFQFPAWLILMLSQFARSLSAETAFDVLAVAKRLKSQGKDVIELQIGDSPYSSTSSAIRAGVEAIQKGSTHYCPSPGLPEFRQTIAQNYQKEFGVKIGPENVVIGPGAKVFEQFFCEAFLDTGDAVLLFSPQFPTYEPNILRRNAKPVYSTLKQQNQFRPDLNDVERFVKREPNAKAIFLNSPHNPTGGVATSNDLKEIANLISSREIALFSDEPYCHMVWEGKHQTILVESGMLQQCLAAYTFSKSYSMSGWRLGYAVGDAPVIETISKMINTSLSCVPPFVQLAGRAAIENDSNERDEVMKRFQKKVELLVSELRRVEGVIVLMPAGTFYVFPDVSAICEKMRIRSHGLAMFLLEGADDRKGVACLGGECFGAAGEGFIRFSCAEPDERLVEAVRFFADAISRKYRVQRYLRDNPKYRL
jgi:aspartate aminotransferase